MRDYIQALKVNPAYIEVFNNMAWIMATSPDERLRDGKRAVAYAEKAVGSAPDINFLDTLAAAYAEAGRFDEAVAIENRIISLLASNRRSENIPLHVKRMSIYEEGRPYREAITIEPVSAVIDLEGELAALDKLVFAPEVSTVAYEPAEAARNLTAQATHKAQAPAAALLSQSETESALSVPKAYSQSVQTAPDVPVEISLAADPEGIPLTFEIETVPYQGSLQGTLPNLLYTPRPAFEGVDRFTFRARNAAGLSNLATVTITVTEPPPEAPADTPASAPAAPEITTAAPQSEQPQVAPTLAPAPAADQPAVEEDASLDADEGEAALPEQAAADDSQGPATAPLEEAASDEPAPSPAVPEAEPMEGPATSAITEPDSGLPSGAIYTIQVYSVKEAAAAAEIVENLSAEGYAAFSLAVEVPEKGPWHRIFINSYPSMAAAREGLERLDPERFKDAFIRRMPDGVQRPAAVPLPQPARSAAAPAAEPDQPAEIPAAEVAVSTSPPAPEPTTEVSAQAPVPEPIKPAEPPASDPDTPAEPLPEADSAEQQAIPVADKAYPYAYQIKAYKEREEAFQLAVELTSQGHTAFIGRGTMGSTGVWYRIYIGCYETPEEAEKHRADIIRAGFPDAFLTPVPLAIVVRPDESDPAGENLESRLMASGFLPYRLPEKNPNGTPIILVGGFRQSEDAAQVLAALEQSGFKGEIRPR
jgi:cell division septation protein DedD